jgi:hypothetical protein
VCVMSLATMTCELFGGILLVSRGLIEIEDDASGVEVVAVVGLKVLFCLVTADGSVFCLTSCNVRGTSS